jgi:exopolyphosphatase/guanosine-5'-triphosphate,3'-diphosphate pyrophosphatase
MKIASIDIGTNTCNLLIADYTKDKGISFLHREKKAITLINKDFTANTISPGSVSHLLNVLNDYKITISAHKADRIVATATSGIRSAANRNSVIDTLETGSGIKIRVIDGNKEAELAWKGVKNAVKFDENPVLIIDIGGGSIEFIICNNLGIIWKSSYDIGVARMLVKHGFSDPLTDADMKNIYSILDSTISEVFANCHEYGVKTLVGCSGSFETFAALVKFECPDCNIGEKNSANLIDICRFMQIYQKLVTYNEEQRIAMPGMEIIRVKMIPVASVIVKYLLEKLKVDSFIQSDYSIKEGTLFDYIEERETRGTDG